MTGIDVQHHSNDGLVKIEDPFTSYDFLNALEKAIRWRKHWLVAVSFGGNLKNKLVGAVPYM